MLSRCALAAQSCSLCGRRFKAIKVSEKNELETGEDLTLGEYLKLTPKRRVLLSILSREGEEAVVDGWAGGRFQTLGTLHHVLASNGATFAPPLDLHSLRLPVPQAPLKRVLSERKKGKRVDKAVKTATYDAQVAESRSFKLVEHSAHVEVLVESFVSAVDGPRLGQAYDLIQYFCERSQSQDVFPPITRPDAFNALIEGYAVHRGQEKQPHQHLRKIEQLLLWLKREYITPDLRTVAAIFSGYHPSDCDEPCGKYAELALRVAQEHGIPLRDILRRRFYTKAEAERLVWAVSTVVPDFEPDWEAMKEGVPNPLVTAEPSTATSNPYQINASKDELLRRLDEQLELERRGVLEVGSCYGESGGGERTLDSLRDRWAALIRRGFAKHRARMEKEMAGRRGFQRYDGLFYQLEQEEYQRLLLDYAEHLCSLSLVYSKSFAHYATDLGGRLEQLIYCRKAEERGVLGTMRDVYSRYLDAFLTPEPRLCRLGLRGVWEECLQAESVASADFNLDLPVWPNLVKKQVGQALLDILVDSVTVQEKRGGQLVNCPAFLRTFRQASETASHQVVHLVPRPSLLKLVMDSPDRKLTFVANAAPSIVPPPPCLSHRQCGHLLMRGELVRAPKIQRLWMTRQLGLRLEKNQDSLRPVLDAVSQLSSVPWMLNEPVLDVMLRVFREGGDMSLAIPNRAHDLPPVPKITPHHSHEESRKLWAQRFLARKTAMETHSLWCTELYTLSIAEKYRGVVVWLPHNLDFRGRAYPVPPYFSHMGSDGSKGMLRFVLGKPLGQDGLRWLKIHLANLTGKLKKATLEEREAFVDQNLPHVLDSARDPLGGEGWWRASEEPWQTLAVCMEIAAALESPGGAESFVSHLPVQQDGSCNGLQHYSALGRDIAGAVSVNVAPSPRPQDVYSEVAALVEKKRAAAAEKGEKVPILIGPDLIDRAVVKRTVMTIVYGVTQFGARLQVYDVLKDRGMKNRAEMNQISSWVGKATFLAISDLFTSARSIQDWLTDCSRVISKDCMETVEWVTPLGLPVAQPYLATQKHGKTGPHGKKGTPVWDKRQIAFINVPQVGKQGNAFAPNFVHSLDASHMMMTALRSQRHGLTFAAVHDCFWTHAADTARLNQFTREEFVRLHETRILDDLGSFFEETYVTEKLRGNVDPVTLGRIRAQFRALPPLGDLDIRQVLDSVYFFS